VLGLLLGVMDNPLNVKVVPVLTCSVCCFLTIFAIIALPLSFKSLEQGKYALPLSWSTQKIGDEVYTEPGMYMVGLGNMLVAYPSTFQSMYFTSGAAGISEDPEDPPEFPVIRRGPLRARSSDGLEMLVSLSFQWQINPEAMKPLYDILGGGVIEESLYRDEFVRFARAAIVESCSTFSADYFFTHRLNITNVMFEKMKEAFNRPDIGMQISITGLQLREVDLPDQFDVEIVKTQEQKQEVMVALAERKEQTIVEEKQLMIAQYKLQQVKQEALAVAARTILLNEAEVSNLLYHQQRQADANAAILGKFWDSADPWARLFEMMELHALNVHNDSRVLISL
jgi:regulator of protease activity HflC (stomatin/prohibitin superfamily)